MNQTACTVSACTVSYQVVFAGVLGASALTSPGYCCLLHQSWLQSACMGSAWADPASMDRKPAYRVPTSTITRGPRGAATTNPAIPRTAATVPDSASLDRGSSPSARPAPPSEALLTPRRSAARRQRIAFRSRLRSHAELLAKLRAVPARRQSHCGAVTEQRPVAALVSIRQRMVRRQDPAEGLIRQIFELLPRGVLDRCHSTSRAVPRSPSATHWSRPRPICRISALAVYPSAAERVSQSLRRSTN